MHYLINSGGGTMKQKQKGRQIPLMLVAIGDIILINVALLIAYFLRFSGELPVINVKPFYQLTPFIVIFTIVIFEIFDLYKRNWKGINKDFRTILSAVFFVFLLTNTATFWLRGFAFPRSVLFIGLMNQIILIWLWRSCCWQLERKIYGLLNVVAIGLTNEKEMVDKLLLNKGWYFNLTKVIFVEDMYNSPELEKADGVFILPSVPDDYKSELLRYCLNRGKAFFLVPSTYEIFLSNADVKQLDDLPVLEVIKFFPSNGVAAAKRIIDIILSALGLIILSPLMIIVALAIKATSPGPVLYLQERVGQGEKPFMLYKFRTMINNAEARTGPVLASDDDPRITPIGKFLRATRIDEIPQLWNVLKGDMSLVGPRPERPFFIEKFKKEIPGYEYRHLVKPGITGLAQIAGKYSTTADDKLRYDLMYIGNLSLLQDIKILVQTVPVVMNSSAAGGVEKRKHNYKVLKNI